MPNPTPQSTSHPGTPGAHPTANPNTPLLSTTAMSARLSKLSGRLLNLTRANKTIRLLRKSVEKHFDLGELLILPDGQARVAKILDAAIRSKPAVLTTAKDTMEDGPAENSAKRPADDDDEELEVWTEVSDAKADAKFQEQARAKAQALADAETQALAELGVAKPYTPNVDAIPTKANAAIPSTTMKNAEFIPNSENEIADTDRPVIVRNWLRRRRVRGYERFDKVLSKVRNFTESVETETGAQDLHLGWPFLTGVCSDLDNTYLQAPLMLFPVRLVKERVPQARWRIEPREDADPQFNETLAHALENYHKTTPSDEFLESVSDIATTDPRSLPTFLAEQLKALGLTIKEGTFADAVTILPEYRSDEVPEGPVGEFNILNHAVMGYFPQADSALRLDYEQMRTSLAAGDALPGHVSMLLAALDESGSIADDSSTTGDELPPDSHASVDTTSERDQWFVLDTDSSQEEVLLAARREQRLVVHGPPGTGKSQVIVNLISDALKRGERVALVCQKRAALDVVFQRLDSVGLSSHVAIVHDHYGDRRQLYQRISTVLGESLPHSTANENALEADISRLATTIDQCTTKLGHVARELHAQRPCGHSAHQLYTLLSKVPTDRRRIHDAAAKLSVTLDRAGLETLGRRIDSLESIHREIDTANHPWAARKSFATFGQSDRQRIETALERAISSCQSASDAVAANPGIEVAPEKAQAAALAMKELAAALATPSPARVSLASALLASGLSSDQLQRRAATLAELAQRLATHITPATPRPKAHCADADVAATALALETFAQHADSMLRFLKPAFWSNKGPSHTYLKTAGVMPTKTAAIEHAAKLRAVLVWRDVDAAMSTLPPDRVAPPVSGAEISALAEQLAACATIAAAIERARNHVGNPLADTVFPLSSAIALDVTLVKLSNAISVAEAMAAAYAAVKAMEEWLAPARVAKLCEAGAKQPRLAESALRDLLRTLSDFERLEAWDAGFGSLAPVSRTFVLSLRDDAPTPLASTALPPTWRETLESGVLAAWLEKTERDAPVLRDVTRRDVEVMRDTLAASIKQRREKMRLLLAAQLLRRAITPRFEPGREVDRRHSVEKPWKDLAYQCGKKSRHFALRRLYAEFAWPLMNAMPCWLVSPETMSAVFPNKQGVFDLVIFDEASQCPVENGLPAAARATRVVIAGDEQQLRPNDLFKSFSTPEEGEEEPDDGADGAATEAESLLTLARARFPERMLTWHYRSKYEELIDFSNHGFYQARLKTVPDLSAIRTPPPIEYIKVEGQWEERCNRREAAALVEQLYQRLMGPWSRKTVGVVTFGVSQRTAIEEEIEHRRSLDEGFDAVFSSAFKPPSAKLDDALFVKNIENVQGDERDIIVFSVGYARDARGRMVSQFGSLSQDGGENRLNVAVSRAREQIVVFASIEPHDLGVSNAKNRGPRLFKQYLEYARAVSGSHHEQRKGVLRDIGGGMARGNETQLAFDSPFEEQVHAELERHNLIVRSQIGVSGYRIDLAVVDPADASRYCLGIECDGATYHSAPSVRERDVYRQRALEMRGWKIHRIWSRNWWANQQAEIERVRALVSR